MKRFFPLFLVAMIAVTFAACSGGDSADSNAEPEAAPKPAAVMSQDGMSLEGFKPLFDGSTLTGWRKLTEYSGDDGMWEVIDGNIAGDQYPEGKGGLLVREETYSNYEVYAEVKADYPIDSGLFLRVQGNVLSYQITIDYRPEGEVGAIYCPGGGAFLEHHPEGEQIWIRGEYNTVRTRIEGQPAHITVWINGEQIADYTDTMVDGAYRVPESGFFGIQVHPGDSWGSGNKVWFRKIMIKEL